METIGCQFWRFVKGGGGYRKTPVFRQRRAQTETPFAAEFHDSRAAAFLLCPLMRQNGPFVTSRRLERWRCRMRQPTSAVDPFRPLGWLQAGAGRQAVSRLSAAVGRGTDYSYRC